MKLWKQTLISLVLVTIAVCSWLYFNPQGQVLLAQYGLDRFVPNSTGEMANGQKPQGGQRPGGNRGALVTVALVQEDITRGRINALGSGQAARTVSIRPSVAGQIGAINVSSGLKVEAGDVLIELEAAEEKLALERAQLGLKTTEDKLERLSKLFERGSISTVEVEAARDEVSLARLAERDAQLALERRTVTAPIGGTLGILTVSVGDYVTSQNDVATIDDRSQIVVDFFVPERNASLMAVGLPVTILPTALPGEEFTGTILATDNRIDEASRTLRVRASIPNPESRLRAGMSFEIVMDFPGESYPAIDPLALQWDSNGSYVWRVRDNRAERVPAIIIQRNSDSVLIKSELSVGDMIITEGVQSVRGGAAVNIANAEDIPSDQRTATVPAAGS